MATVAHCFYCFEALAASLEKRDSLTLSRVQDLWAQFNETEIKEESLEQLIQAGDHLEPGQNRALRELDIEEDRPAQPVSRSDLRLPIISRLQNTSPASSSSSSTPSSLSATSSRAALTDASKSSSKTSFFSFSRRSPFSPVQKEEEEAEAEVNDLEDEEDEEGEEEEHPLFVTWNILSSRGYKSLRGCIGTFDAQDLSSGLKSYALTAAFDDTRFSPITLSELPSLSVSVTLLTAFTPAADPFDWTLGTHGIRILFSHHGKHFGATYLPDVAAEQGWTKEETLISLMRKAGWSGRSGDWAKVADLKVVRYQGRKESAAFKEWRVWRDWVQKVDERRR